MLNLIEISESGRTGQSLYRYMDVSKFLDFALTRRLPLSRLDGFEDPYEAISRNQLERIFGNSEIENEDVNFSDDHNVDSTGPNNIKELSIEERQKGYFASCWFADTHESLAMWRLYAGGDGAMISINRELLVGLLRDTSYTLNDEEIIPEMVRSYHHGHIEYINFNDDQKRNSMKLRTKIMGFHKDLAYKHEREYRFLLKLRSEYRKQQAESCIPVFARVDDIYDQDITVVLNPMMQDWQRRNISALLSRLNRNFKIKESNLRLKKHGS